jgi:hypothetical protein
VPHWLAAGGRGQEPQRYHTIFRTQQHTCTSSKHPANAAQFRGGGNLVHAVWQCSPWFGSVVVNPMSSSTTPLSTGRSTYITQSTGKSQGDCQAKGVHWQFATNSTTVYCGEVSQGQIRIIPSAVPCTVCVECRRFDISVSPPHTHTSQVCSCNRPRPAAYCGKGHSGVVPPCCTLLYQQRSLILSIY